MKNKLALFSVILIVLLSACGAKASPTTSVQSIVPLAPRGPFGQ